MGGLKAFFSLLFLSFVSAQLQKNSLLGNDLLLSLITATTSTLFYPNPVLKAYTTNLTQSLKLRGKTRKETADVDALFCLFVISKNYLLNFPLFFLVSFTFFHKSLFFSFARRAHTFLLRTTASLTYALTALLTFFFVLLH